MIRWTVVCCMVAAVVGVALPARAEKKDVVFDEKFDVEKGWELEVRVGDMDVEIIPGGSDEARVVVTLTGNLDKARDRFEDMNFRARLREKTLQVETRERHIWSTSWWGSGHWGMHMAVTVPEQFDLDVETSDGNIDANGIRGDISLTTSDGNVTARELKGPAIYIKTSDGNLIADGLEADEVELKTSDGNVRTERVQGAGVTLSSADGDVTARDIRADRVSARTSDGDLSIRLSGGELQGRTSDGNIDVWIDNGTSLDLSTSDGDIVIHAPSGFGAELDLKGEDVRLGHKVMLEGDISEHRIRGTIGDGGRKIRARTSDGTVSLRLD